MGGMLSPALPPRPSRTVYAKTDTGADEDGEGAVDDDGDTADDDDPEALGPQSKEDRSKGPSKKAQSLCRRKTKCCDAFCAQASSVCFKLLVTAFIVVLIMLITSAMSHVSNTIVNTTYVTVQFALPTVQQWETHQGCVESPACDLCSASLLPSMQPQPSRTALVASPGAGSLLWRHDVEQATRLITTVDVCDVNKPSWFNPFYAINCGVPLIYAHSVMTHLTEFPVLPRDYAPTHLILLLRDPFEEAIWGFHIRKTCSSSVRLLSCVGKEASLKDFAEGGWEEFAISAVSAQMAMIAAFDVSPAPHKLTIFYEDLVARKDTVISSFFEFVTGLAPNPSRGNTCVMSNPDNTLAPTSRINVEDVFTPELIARVCAIVKPKWDAKRWGARCV
jgi:hypothetical protein